MLWVEAADGGAMSMLSEPAQLEALMEGLNRRGIRERGLLNALKRRQPQISATLAAQPPQFTADLADISRCAWQDHMDLFFSRGIRYTCGRQQSTLNPHALQRIFLKCCDP